MNFGLAVGSSKRAGTPWLFRRWVLMAMLGLGLGLGLRLRLVLMAMLVLGLGWAFWCVFKEVWGFGYWLSMRGGLGGLGVVG